MTEIPWAYASKRIDPALGGTYTLEWDAQNLGVPGADRVDVWAFADDPTPLVYGGPPRPDTLPIGGQGTRHAFTGTAGDVVKVTANADFADALRIINPDGTVLAETVPEPGRQRQSQWTVTLSQTGAFRIQVWNPSPTTTSTYQLSLQRLN